MSHEQFRQSPTLAEVLEAFLGKYHNPKTRKGMERDVGRAVRWLGPDKRLDQLTRLDIMRYVGETITSPTANGGKPYLPNTARGKIKAVITWLNWCHDNQFIEERLSSAVSLPAEPEPDARQNAYTMAECDLLIDYAAGRTEFSGRRLRDLALFVFCHDTGARVGSLVKLQREHIDLEAHMATLYNTKRRRWYRVAFGVYCAEVLGEWLAVVPDVPRAFLWNSRQPGKPMTSASLSQIPGRACDVLGIDRHGVHGFRRAVGVRMIDAGESVEYVADVLNDSVQVATKHYSPRTIPAAKEAAKKVAYVPPHLRKIRRFDAG